jgi:hypothetical protein
MPIMATNPYATPKSNVGDAPPRRAVDVQPKEIRYAVWLLWLCIPLWIPTAVYEYGRAAVDARSAIAVSLLLVLSLFVVLIIFINRGHNWARISFAVVTLLALLSLIASYSEFLTYPPWNIGLNVILFLIDVLVIYLTFTHPGALWFRRVYRAANDEL